MKMTAVAIHRIADGKLVEKWSDKDQRSDKDQVAHLRQLGVIPRMGPPGE